MDCDGRNTPCRTAQSSPNRHVTPLFTIAGLERAPHEPALKLSNNNNISSMESSVGGGACTSPHEDITSHVSLLSSQQRTHEQQRRRFPSPSCALSPADAYLYLRRLLEEVERQQSKLASRLASEEGGIHTDDAHAEGERLASFPAVAAVASAIIPHGVHGLSPSATSLSFSAHAPLSTRRAHQSATAGRALRRLSYLAQWTLQLLEAYPLVEHSDNDAVKSPASLPLEDVFTAPLRSQREQAAVAVADGAAATQLKEREEGTTGGGDRSGMFEVLGGVQDQDADTDSTRHSATANAAAAAVEVMMGEEENIEKAAEREVTTVLTAGPADITAIDHTEGEEHAHDSTTTTPANAEASALKRQQGLLTAHTGALVNLIALPAVDATATSEDNRAAVCEHRHRGDGDSDGKGGALKDREGSAEGSCRRPDRIADLHEHAAAAAVASSSLSSSPPPPVVPRDRQPLRCDVGPTYDPPQTAAEQRTVLLAQGGCCAHCGTVLPLPRHDINAAWWAAVSCCCCCCCSGGGGGDDRSTHDNASEDSGDEHQTLLSQPPHQRGGTAAEASESRLSPSPSNVVRRLRLTSSLSPTTDLVMPAGVLADMTPPATASSTVSHSTNTNSINAPRGSSTTTGSAEALFCTFEGRFLCQRCFDAPLGNAVPAGQRLVEPEEWQTRTPDHQYNNSRYHVGDSRQSVSPVRAAVTQAAEHVNRWWVPRHATEDTPTAQRSQQPQPPFSVSGHRDHQQKQQQQQRQQQGERTRCLLPAHVLLRWDFNRYPVSASAAALLRRMETPDASSSSRAVSRLSQMEGRGDTGVNTGTAAASKSASPLWVLPALYDISHIHPALYREVPALATASQLRKRLCLLHAQAWWCLRYRSEVWGVHRPNTSSRDTRKNYSNNGAPVQREGDAAPTTGPSSRQQRTTVFMPAHDVGSRGRIDLHRSGGDDDEGEDGETAAAQRWRAATPSPPRCSPRRRYLVERAEGWSLLDLCRLTSEQGAAGGTPQLVAELRTMQAALQEHVGECAYCRVRRRVTSEGQ